MTLGQNQNLENKFIGKNFVFDERRVREFHDIISKCHQCGTPDDHVNCKNEACHLLFIQCESCSKSSIIAALINVLKLLKCLWRNKNF